MPKFSSLFAGLRLVAARSPRRISCAVAMAAAVLICASCSKPEEPPPPPPPSRPAPTPRPPKPTPTPTPPPTPTPAPTPTPVVHHYAPAGVYYLTTDVTVRLKAGLKGVVAGTPVRMIVEGAELMQVTDNEDQFEVKKSQVTNDMDIAAAIQKRASADANASEAFRAQQEAIVIKQQEEQTEFLRTHPLGGPGVSPTPK